ncbi:hypothetical protein V5799_017318 [Amblyomma americanum]|uniref:THAP-type domain-containing protein n=1 Tax=Amblyomma americanum TaxID=6943 RepID=A0AAQ4F3N2_AMBAM
MPTVCLVRQCRTTYQNGSNVRFHKLPGDPQRRALWLRAINRDMGSQTGYVCSEHFLPGDYETNLDVLRSLGMDLKNARIKRDAVPTQNLSPGAPPKKRRRSEELPEPQDVEAILTAEEAQTSPQMVDSCTQTPRNTFTVACQTDGRDVRTRCYLLPAIDKIWQQQQEELFRQLEGCTVDLAGDGRCDSPGFCAKFLTYSLHVAQLNKILHFEQVQVGECADVQSSTSMEKFAFVKSLNMVKERGLKVASVTTDRHGQVTKYMRTQEPTIRHYYDCWHISKAPCPHV